MKPKKKKKQKASLLARLFGAKGKAEPARKKAAGPRPQKTPTPEQSAPKPKPPTPLDRSIAEIKHMVRIGQNSPERLATILGNLIKTQKEKKQQDQEKFDKLVRDILARQQQKEQQEPPQ